MVPVDRSFHFVAANLQAITSKHLIKHQNFELENVRKKEHKIDY